MQAQIINQYGEPEVFQTVEVPRPEVAAGQILIRVAATSVNPADYKLRRYGPPIAPALPAILHGDVAGTIVEIGSGVASHFKVGDAVYTCAGGVRGTGGALAEFMVADATLVAHKPTSLTFAEAAALPLVAITAWEGLIDRAKIQPGQTVLVHGVTGGVSHIGIQLAKWAGAKVFATGSSERKLVLARELGADVAINYRTESVADYVKTYTAGKGFDVVFDTIGGDTLTHSFEAAALNGTVVSISTNASYDLSPMHSKGLSLHVVFMLIPLLHGIGRARHGEILTEVAKLVDAGQLKPLIDPHTFTFAEVGAAHRLLEEGQAIGKIVLTQPLYA
jgi:NADPH2:quinone reductase